MSATVAINDERRVVERRSIHERRISADSRKATQVVESSQQAIKKNDLALDLLGSIFAAVVSFIVLIFTGLYSGASSTITQIILVASIVCAFVVAFRRALYT